MTSAIRRSDNARLSEFRDSLALDSPPEALGRPLAALWHLAKGDWDAAHASVQDDPTKDGAWVHALIHRIEGDDWNARYWYGRAKRSMPNTDFVAEREVILSELLSTSS